MIFFALFIGAILIVAAVRNSQGALFSALGQDVPAFVVWAAAIIALGAIGFAPGLKPVSRGLLALVLVVLILRNYKQILAGFDNAWKNPPAYTPGTATNGAAASGSKAQSSGTTNDIISGAAHGIVDIFGGGSPTDAVTTGAF